MRFLDTAMVTYKLRLIMDIFPGRNSLLGNAKYVPDDLYLDFSVKIGCAFARLIYISLLLQ